jgi:hypothetical protein
LLATAHRVARSRLGRRAVTALNPPGKPAFARF